MNTYLVPTICYTLLWCWGCNSEERPGGIPVVMELSLREGRAAKKEANTVGPCYSWVLCL